MSNTTLQKDYASCKSLIDDRLLEILQEQAWPAALRNAIEYSLLTGGKRLRPVLVLLASEVCGGSHEKALPAACAIEMVHTYSLIHDDLPSMDDDELRRGRPTSHVVFGEALAILAGDGLLTLAFETIGLAKVSPEVISDCLRILATAAGGQGMVGGQILDLEAERGDFPRPPEAGEGLTDEKLCSIRADSAVPESKTDSQIQNQTSEGTGIRVEQIIRIHRMKTGALITAALELGAAVAQGSPQQRRALADFGQCIGLAFQIADDLLDVTGNDKRLGKETGRDSELGKLTYPSLIGVDASRQKAASLIDAAGAALQIFGDKAESLMQLARFIVERDH